MHPLPVFLLVTALAVSSASGQQNKPPRFLPGGDMLRISVPEDATVGTSIYTLKGEDPDGGEVHYSISGQTFEVNRNTGVVTLVRPLDREKQDLIEVIISITDTAPRGNEPNTVSLRREITVIDRNDNAPQFENKPYSLSIPENTRTGNVVYEKIIIMDADSGGNGEVTVTCDPIKSTPRGACNTFGIKVVETTRYPGTNQARTYTCQLVLNEPLDFERRSSYSLFLTATDNPFDQRSKLRATATVTVQVEDVQDQPPVFLNAPYSSSIAEGTAQGVSILQIRAKDGDAGHPRKIVLKIEGDYGNHFELVTEETHGGTDTVATLVTTDSPLDRENPAVLENGGIYTFNVTASEVGNFDLIGDSTSTQVMIVVTDVDDHLPKFNKDISVIQVSEDIRKGSPLPGLNLVVSDDDFGDNAFYKIFIRSTTSSDLDNVLSLHPSSGAGRTPINIRVEDPLAFDYDEPINEDHTLEFEVLAIVTKDGQEMVAAKSQIKIELFDANDNAPAFYKPSYKLTIPENLKPGFLLEDIKATDPDSGDFGKIHYSLQGFGADRFSTDFIKGGIYLAKNCPLNGCVDYETQKSYSLTLTAKDGGGKFSTTSIQIEIEDINDNAPKFQQSEYRRTFLEGETRFNPQLFVRAVDIDGPSQGNGAVTYSISASNAPEGTFLVDPDTGELKLLKPAAAGDTLFGQYELKIKASDHGQPESLHSEASVVIRVGVPGNQQPVFKGGPVFETKVFENIEPGKSVINISAHDPDGQDSELTYKIVAGARDNFLIDEFSGIISVAPGGIAEREDFKILVAAIDDGKPYRATATATIMVHVVDINNEPPKFDEDYYEKHISERLDVGEKVLQVTATDPDLDAKLNYSLLDPEFIKDKTGVEIQSNSNKFFKINSTTGDIFLARKLDHEIAAVVTFNVLVVDENAEENIELQNATCEVTFFVEAYNNKNPVFNEPWSPSNPVFKIKLGDQRSLGTQILSLSATDPLRGGFPISKIQLLTNEDDIVSLTPDNRLLLNRDLPYDLNNKTFKATVRSEADGDSDRFSDATVIIELDDINHYTPSFTQRTYKSRIAENAKHPASVLTVNATDNDDPSSPSGHGQVRYSLTGSGSQLFTIDPITGIVSIAKGAALDRETQPILSFYAVAVDTPNGGPEQRKSTAHIEIEVLDVNDNPPKFEKSSYTAVIPENVNITWSVIKVHARDADESLSGQVEYEFADLGDAQGLLSINTTTGEIRTKSLLTGKGRQDPYTIQVRAIDLGQPSLHGDAPLYLYISDVGQNDGIPIFLRPMPNETAFAAENSTIGSPVFQVVATDPDDPNTANGMISYKLLDNEKFSKDTLAFRIDRETGLITTRQPLDRERQSEYTLIVEVQDDGSPPKKASSILRIEVTDVDDHKPVFQRSIDADEIEFRIREDAAPGVEIGTVAAVDNDLNENADIDYSIIFGNDERIFNITRTKDNKGLITLNKRVDRETKEDHLITIKCFPARTRPPAVRKEFNPQDMSEIQVKISVEDVDDNVPVFKKANLTVGVRIYVPVDTPLATIEATDDDANAPEMHYKLLKAEFDRPGLAEMSVSEDTPIFRLNERTGELHTATSMVPFADGIFTLYITAFNSEEKEGSANTTIRVFVWRDTELLKFVFAKPLAEVRRSLPQFASDLEHSLPDAAKLNIYDTQYLIKKGGSIDFSTTTSCFQLLGENSFNLTSMQKMLTFESNPMLSKVFDRYGVQSVERCSPVAQKVKATTVQIWVLAIAALVGFFGFVSMIFICASHSRYTRKIRSTLRRDDYSSNEGYAYVISHAGSVLRNPAPSIISQSFHGSEWPAEFIGTPASLLPPGVVT
ncbi:cadherin-23 [Neocloeon triangulifer]|uniref:cadherin-23 n=1 Tax=Neocloeon triangulifer TaxID=2078957 RepID=UPI00286F1D0E|nr:cadherin-23 [Neocloeon triangulifer]